MARRACDARADGDGRYRDLLVGVGLGFLGGFLVLFLAADSVFSQRYMLGAASRARARWRPGLLMRTAVGVAHRGAQAF